MGDMADYIIDQGAEEEVSDRMYSMACDYITCNDKELKDHTAQARTAKIMSIRNCEYPLTFNQRWCLAVWAADRDNRNCQYGK